MTNNITIIGIDHGYGNIKTAHTCFKAGVTAYDKEPTFQNNMLIYKDRYYIIGEEHKEFISDKMADIIVTIEQALKASSSVNAVGGLLQLLVSNVTQSAEQSVDNNSLDDALDFTDNF